MCLNTLVVESGGTKTDWYLISDHGDNRELQTSGLNPSLVKMEEIHAILVGRVLPWLKQTRLGAIHYFGAGLGRPIGRIEMRRLLKEALETDCPIQVSSDLIGAAYGCLGSDKGLVGILGTGSVALRYDGQAISARSGGWGYLLGDEGSGSDLGKTLLRKLLEHSLPEPIVDAYRQFSGREISQIPQDLYRRREPTQFLARQVAFLAENQSVPEIRELLESRIRFFLRTYLLALEPQPEEKLVFTGGVARIFSELVEKLCRAEGIINVRVLKEAPIRAIVRFLSQFPPSKPRSAKEPEVIGQSVNEGPCR